MKHNYAEADEMQNRFHLSEGIVEAGRTESVYPSNDTITTIEFDHTNVLDSL